MLAANNNSRYASIPSRICPRCLCYRRRDNVLQQSQPLPTKPKAGPPHQSLCKADASPDMLGPVLMMLRSAAAKTRCDASAEVSLRRMHFVTCCNYMMACMCCLQSHKSRNVAVSINPEAYAVVAADCLCPPAGCEQGGSPEEVPRPTNPPNAHYKVQAVPCSICRPDNRSALLMIAPVYAYMSLCQ